MKRCSPASNSPPRSPIFRSKRRNFRRRETEIDSSSEVSLSTASRESEKAEDSSSLASQTSRSPDDLKSVRLSRVSGLPADRLLSVGCPLLDSGLLGGLRAGELTELVGESSSGKTQFSLQTALEAADKTDIYIEYTMQAETERQQLCASWLS